MASYNYRYASNHSKDFCALVIPKAWRYTILVETHDKMGHQGNNRTYSLIKRQYYWKGMAKDVKDYIQLQLPTTITTNYQLQLETFHKFLKPTLKKMCAEDQDNWDDYIEQVLGTYRGVLNLTTGESPFFLVYGRDGNQPLHQLLQPLTRFLGDLDSGLLCLDQHRLSLSIAEKYLDDHRFLTAEKTTDRVEPGFKVGDRVYFKKNPQENGTSNGEQDTGSSALSVKDITCT